MILGQAERALTRLQTCNTMNITAVKKYTFDTGKVQTSLRAYAEVTLADFVAIKGFRVLVGKSGDLFVGMPFKKGKDGKYYDYEAFKKNASILRDRNIEFYKEFF
ncbi:MAG: DNA-binding cell septation regulator SpoVG [Nitrospinales bacterium]|jgi:DNA-binding cell septation regulator SpoVG